MMADDSYEAMWWRMGQADLRPMTQPVSPDKPAGEALPFGIDDGQNIAAKVKICRTPPPSALDDEVVAVLTECADDLEAEVRNRWGDDARLSHKLERDLSPVVKARDLLTRLKDRGTD